MSDRHFWLSEVQFARIQSLLPNKVRGMPRVDGQRVISGIVPRHPIRPDATRCTSPPRFSQDAL